MDDDDEEDESDDAIPEEAVINKFLDMSTYIEPRSGKQAELIQFMKVMLVQGYEIQSNVAMLRVQVEKMKLMWTHSRPRQLKRHSVVPWNLSFQRLS